MADVKADASAQETPKPGEPKSGEQKPGDPAAATPKPDAGKEGEKPVAEAKPDASKKAEPGGKADDAEASPKAPEKYDLKLPDGADKVIDQSFVDRVAAIAKANDLTNEQAQEQLERAVDTIVAQSEAFRVETEGDPDYGGDHLEETQQLARRVIDKVRPTGHKRAEAFNKLLAQSGYGNHIEVVSFLADLGKLMREDTPPAAQGGGGKTPEKKAPEAVLYGEEKPS